MNLQLIPLPALKDNYIWLIKKTDQCIVVDPGDAEVVIRYLESHSCCLSAILITHYHWDHTQGISALIKKWSVPVFGPCGVEAVTHIARVEDEIKGLEGSLSLNVLEIPGHTLDHLAYYVLPAKDNPGMVFCGDTLFGAGCGRVFEGTLEQMYQSLMRLRSLPSDTLVCPGHEYTVANCRFAAWLEPHYSAVQARLQSVIATRAAGHSTLPSRLEEEKSTNPFLRCDEVSLVQSVLQHFPKTSPDPLEVFGTIRNCKDHWNS